VAAGRPLTCAATTNGWLRLFDLLELRTDHTAPHPPAWP
jgi:hypothetical protein